MQSYQMKSRFLKEIPEEFMNEHVFYEGLKISGSFRTNVQKKSEKNTLFGPSVKYDFNPKNKKT